MPIRTRDPARVRALVAILQGFADAHEKATDRDQQKAAYVAAIDALYAVLRYGGKPLPQKVQVTE